MPSTFRALRLFKTDAGQEARIVDLTDDDLMKGDVTVRVHYSTVNYKDGLALTGRAPIVRVWPLTPGIDFSGVVESSSHADFAAGDRDPGRGPGPWPQPGPSPWQRCPSPPRNG